MSRAGRHRALGRGAFVVAAAVVLLVLLASRALGDDQCADPFDCLPAWRWDAGDFHTDLRFRDVEQMVGSTLPRAMFGLANLIWQATLWVVGVAVDLDLLGNVDSAFLLIDRNYLTVADAVGPALVPLVFTVGIFAFVIRLWQSANGVGGSRATFGQVAFACACLGILFWLAFNASAHDERGALDEPGDHPAAGSTVRGSPGWWLRELNRVTSWAADHIGEAFHDSVAAPERDVGSDWLHCDAYTDTLRQMAVDRATEDDHAIAIASLTSVMWERSYMPPFARAQFGDTASGRRAYCYLMETQADIPAAWQHEVIGQIDGASRPHEAVLSRTGSPEGTTAEMIMVGACVPGLRWESQSGGRFGVHPDFRWMYVLQGDPSAWESARDAAGALVNPGEAAQLLQDHFTDDSDGPQNTDEWAETCAAWWDDGELGDEFYIESPSQAKRYTYAPDDVAAEPGDGSDAAAARDAAVAQQAARSYVLGLRGWELAGSTGASFMAIIIAVIYFLVLGGVSLGSIVAQFGVVAFAIAAPVVLTVGLWPSDWARQKVTKVAKILVGMTFARAVMLLILGLLGTIIGVIISLFDALAGREDAVAAAAGGSAAGEPAALAAGPITAVLANSGSGFMGGALMAALPPIVAYLLLKQLCRKLGFGNPLGLRGGMRMVGNVAENAGNAQPGGRSRMGRMLAGYAMGTRQRGPHTPVKRLVHRLRGRRGNEGATVQAGEGGASRTRNQPPGGATGSGSALANPSGGTGGGVGDGGAAARRGASRHADTPADQWRRRRGGRWERNVGADGDGEPTWQTVDKADVPDDVLRRHGGAVDRVVANQRVSTAARQWRAKAAPGGNPAARGLAGVGRLAKTPAKLGGLTYAYAVPAALGVTGMTPAVVGAGLGYVGIKAAGRTVGRVGHGPAVADHIAAGDETAPNDYGGGTGSGGNGSAPAPTGGAPNPSYVAGSLDDGGPPHGGNGPPTPPTVDTAGNGLWVASNSGTAEWLPTPPVGRPAHQPAGSNGQPPSGRANTVTVDSGRNAPRPPQRGSARPRQPATPRQRSRRPPPSHED